MEYKYNKVEEKSVNGIPIFTISSLFAEENKLKNNTTANILEYFFESIEQRTEIFIKYLFFTSNGQFLYTFILNQNDLDFVLNILKNKNVRQYNKIIADKEYLELVLINETICKQVIMN
jgi:hypothetical protein